MKRKLTDTERNLTKAGIRRLKREIKEMKEQLDFYKKTRDFKKVKREYQDSIRDYLRKEEDKQDIQAIKMLEAQIEQKTESIKHMQDQLRKGVTVKKNLVVG